MSEEPMIVTQPQYVRLGAVLIALETSKSLREATRAIHDLKTESFPEIARLRALLADVTRKRATRGIAISERLSMYRVVVAAKFDQHFAAFAGLIGDARAEGYFLRVLQYVAENDGRGGRVTVERARFGPVVLTRAWDVVTPKEGARVYDALLASSLCVPYRVGDDAFMSADSSADGSVDKSAPRSEDWSAHILHPPSSTLLPSSPYPSDGSADQRALAEIAGSVDAAMSRHRQPRMSHAQREAHAERQRQAMAEMVRREDAASLGRTRTPVEQADTSPNGEAGRGKSTKAGFLNGNGVGRGEA